MIKKYCAALMCLLLAFMASCGPLDITDTNETQTVPVREYPNAYELLAAVEENSRGAGGFDYTEVFSAGYPELDVSADIQTIRVRASWDGTKYQTYREALRNGSLTLYYETSGDTAEPLLDTFSLSGSGDPGRTGSLILLSDNTLAVVADREGETVAARADMTDGGERLADFLESQNRPGGACFINDPAGIITYCTGIGSAVEDILKETPVVVDSDGSMRCEAVVPGSLISEEALEVSKQIEEADGEFTVSVTDISLEFHITKDGFLSEMKETTRFTMKLFGNMYSKIVVTACVDYTDPGKKPELSITDTDGFTEYSPEELFGMISQ